MARTTRPNDRRSDTQHHRDRFHDVFGNVATGYTGTVHFTSSDARGGSAGQLHLHHRCRRGRRCPYFANGATLETAGTRSITATDTVTGTITGTQDGVAVTTAGASKLAFVQRPSTTKAGAAIAPSVTVQVQDAYGDDVADLGATVTMSVSTGPGGHRRLDDQRRDEQDRLATFDNLVLDTPGSYNIQAASSRSRRRPRPPSRLTPAGHHAAP